MGILGKDLFNISYNFFEFTALFSNENIEIEDHSYKHGEILTGFLNYNCSEYFSAFEALKILYEDNQNKSYVSVEKKMIKMIFAMPLYKDFGNHEDWFDIKKSSSPYGNLDDFEKLYSDLKLLEQYRWFVKEMFYDTKWKDTSSKFANLIENNGVRAFTSGVSLGKYEFTDPARLSVQYEVRESADDGKVRLFEKMIFTRLIAFLYIDLFKAIMNDYCPKPCRLCGKFFLQEPGFTYEYCTNTALGEETKSCRDIGSVRSFKDKIKNNPVWEIHQRAYKKYYARMKKTAMSESDFAMWSIEAEKIRDQMLKVYDRDRNTDLTEYAEKLNKF